MFTKYKLFIYLILLSLQAILCSCPGGNSCLDPNPKYGFDVPASLNPDKEKIALGDTIYFNSEFSSMLTPVGSTELVDYSNAKAIGGVILIIEYLPNFGRRDAAYDFEYISYKGEAYNDKSVPNPERAQQIRYKEEGNTYRIKIGIVPKKKGNFYFLLGGAYSNSRVIKGKDRCDRATFNISLNNDQQKTRTLVENWAGSSIGNPGDGYAFTVY